MPPTAELHPLIAAAIAEGRPALLAVYADWLDERSLPFADGWRQLAEGGYWPVFSGVDDRHFWSSAEFWQAEFPIARKMADELPEEAFRRLAGIRRNWTTHALPSLIEALNAAAHAFANH
jgi:hypothetical protein